MIYFFNSTWSEAKVIVREEKVVGIIISLIEIPFAAFPPYCPFTPTFITPHAIFSLRIAMNQSFHGPSRRL